jgi:multiple sugar transport system substrate-binding protein
MLLAGCTLVAACSGAPEPAAAPTASSSPASPEESGSATTAGPLTLRFQVYGGPSELAAYQRLADVYEQRYGEITVEVRAVTGVDRAAALLEAQFAAGDAPDVFLLDRDRLARFVSEQRLTPVDQLLEQRDVLFGDNYQRLGLEAFSADSALQCMPHDVSPLVLYYNTELVRFPEPSVPEEGQEPEEVPSVENGWTWEQFAETARQVARPGVDAFYVDPSLETVAALVRSAGDDIADDPRNPSTLTLSGEGPREALGTVLATLRRPGLTPTPRQLRRKDAVTRFEEGRLAMLVGTRALVPRLRAATGLAFDVFPLPNLGRYRSVTSLSGYCIASSSTEVEAAADFLAFASSPEGGRITALSGAVVPENLAVLHSPAFPQSERQPVHADVFAEAVRRSDPMPYAVAWPEVRRETAPLLERLFTDRDVDVDRLLTRIDRRSARILAPPEAG